MSNDMANETIEECDLLSLLSPEALEKLTKARPPNACTLCDVHNKFQPESWHSKLGWCPCKQRYTLRASKGKDPDKKGCGERLRDLLLDPWLEQDADAQPFLNAVRTSDHMAVRNALKGVGNRQVRKRKAVEYEGDVEGRGQHFKQEPRPELLLMRVGRDVHRWRWSVFSEAVRVVPPTDAESDPSNMTLDVLLDEAKKTSLELDHDQLRKDDTLATAMHEAVHKGNQPALKRLVDYTNAQLQSARGLNVAHKYKGKLGLWAETQSGHLPIHVVFRRNAPVYHSRAQIVPWLLQLMDEQLGHIRAAASTSCISAEAVHPQGEPLQLPESTLQALSMSMPAGFSEKNNVDIGSFASFINGSTSSPTEES